MKNADKANRDSMTILIWQRRAAGSLRECRGLVWFVMVGMALLAAIPLHSAIASDVRMDRVWEIELQGRVQSFSPSRLTIEVDNALHILSYDFEVIRDGRVVDAGQVEVDAPVALDKRGGSVRRIFLIDEGFR